MLIWATCEAQVPLNENQVKRVEDGSIVVVLDGIEYRGFNPDKVHELRERKIKLDSATAQLAEADKANKELRNALALAMKDTMFAESQRDIAIANASKYKLAYENTDALLKTAEDLIGRRSRVVEFLDSALGRALTDLAVPVTIALVKNN